MAKGMVVMKMMKIAMEKALVNQVYKQVEEVFLSDIKQDYIPRGINHFTFAQQNANIISENDMMAFYIFYFIKPEHQFAIISQWLKFQEMQQQQRRMQ